MSRRNALEQTEPTFALVGKKQKATGLFQEGQWHQLIAVANKTYRINVIKGQRVRMAYSSKHGHKWYGEIYDAETGRRIWDGRVTKATSIRTMLILAGLVVVPGDWWHTFINAWKLIGRAHHGAEHPECRVNRFSSEDIRLARDHTLHGYACKRTCVHDWRASYEEAGHESEHCAMCNSIRRNGIVQR